MPPRKFVHTRRVEVTRDPPGPPPKRESRCMARVKAHPLVLFYFLAFFISWTAMLVVVGGPHRMIARREQVDNLLPLVVLALLSGPSTASLFCIALFQGIAGFRELLLRLLHWNVGVGWYLFALLPAPLSITAILTVLSRTVGSYFTPRIFWAHDKLELLFLAVTTVVFGGFLEELGWTGFVIPRLRQRHSAAATAVIVGVLWGVWHLEVNLWYSGAASGGLDLSVFAPTYFFMGVAQLTAYRFLMQMAWERTHSLLIATLMHGSLIASTAMPILIPPMTGSAFLIWFSASAAVFWFILAIACVFTCGNMPDPAREEYDDKMF